MTRRAVFFKWLLYALAAAAIVLLQNLVLTHLNIAGVHPFLLPAVAAVPATREPRRESVLFAFAFGLLCDLAIPASFPCLYAVSFLLIALLSGLVARRLVNPGLVCSLTVSAAAMLVTDLLRILTISGASGFHLSAALLLKLHELAVTVIFFPAVHVLDYLVYRRMVNE